MRPEGMLDRKEFAEALGLRPGTFVRKLIEFNAEQKEDGKPELKPDMVTLNTRNRPQHWFNPAKLEAFQDAIKAVGIGQRGRPRK